MKQKKHIVLKLTGELIPHTPQGLNADGIRAIATQIKSLSQEYQFSIVTGGGNFFRGAQQGSEVKISLPVSHYVGMLATTMNGLIIQDIFEQLDIRTTLFCALTCPDVGKTISMQALTQAKIAGHCLIFTGGTGNPFFTTDTNAVLRSLQVHANELWKGTKVDGVYTCDPNIDKTAELLPRLTYDQALEQQLGIMDLSAFALAKGQQLRIRIFNIFTPNALLQVAADKSFGSTISNNY